MATHSNILAWKIPCTGEPGGLQSTKSQTQLSDYPPLHTHTHTCIYMYIYTHTYTVPQEAAGKEEIKKEDVELGSMSYGKPPLFHYKEC